MWLTAFIDLPATEFDADVAFWLAATDTSLSTSRGDHGEFASLLPRTGDPWLRVQRLGSGAARLHLDVHADDPDRLCTEAVRLGASLQGNDPVTSFASPGGLAFCVVDGLFPAAAPTPAWPHLSRVDQVCLDIPTMIYDVEAEFWSTLLGRDITASATHREFSRLDWQHADPLKVLLQRCGDQGTVAAHLDLATTDRPAEVARLMALGAVQIRETGSWTTLRDPAGLDFCVTDRIPTPG